MCLSSSSDDCQMELGPLFVSETFLFSGGGGCQWLNFKITLATNDWINDLVKNLHFTLGSYYRTALRCMHTL